MADISHDARIGLPLLFVHRDVRHFGLRPRQGPRQRLQGKRQHLQSAAACRRVSYIVRFFFFAPRSKL